MDPVTTLLTVGVVVAAWAAYQVVQEMRTRRNCRRLQREAATLRGVNERIVQRLIP